MATLADKLRRRGPDGELTEETPEEIQSLAGKVGLQAPPITPLGAAALGANPHQQKMMGAPNQKQAALTLASTPPQSTLQDALRRAQPRNQATTQEASSIHKSQELQNLGGLGDRVSDFIETQRNKLATQAAQATNAETGVAVNSVDQFQGKDISGLKQLLEVFRKHPNDQELLLTINQKLGYDINRQLSPQEVDQLYESAVDSIAHGGAGNVDDDLTVDDLTRINGFGYSTDELSQLLGIPAADISKYSVGQLRGTINATAAAEFNKTSDLEQRAQSGQLGFAERGLARQGAREASRVGTRSSEADIARLEQQIVNADRVQFGGKDYVIDELLKDDTISGIITEYMKSAPDSELRKQLEHTEPALMEFIRKNQAVLEDASTRMEAGATEFQNIQTNNRELQTKPFGGTKLDDKIAAALIPGFGKLQASRVDATAVPLLQYATSIGPDGGRAIADQLNSQLSRDPTFADEIRKLNTEDLKSLGIESDGPNWKNYKRQNDQFGIFQSLDPQDVDRLVSTIVSGVTGAGDAQTKLSQNYSQSLVFGGAAPQSSLLDANGDGLIDAGEELKRRLIEANPKPDLKSSAAGKSNLFEKQAIPPPKALSAVQSSILGKLGNLSGVQSITPEMIQKAKFNIDELIHLEDNKVPTVDRNEIAKQRYWTAINNTKDLIDSTERSGRSRTDQITELQNQLSQQGGRRLDEDRINARIKQLAETEINDALAGSDNPSKDRDKTRQRIRQQKQLISIVFPPFAFLSTADQDALMDIGSAAGTAFLDQLKKVSWSPSRTIPENLGILVRDVLTSVPRTGYAAVAGALDTLAQHVGPAAGNAIQDASNVAKAMVEYDLKTAAEAAAKTAAAAPKATVEAIQNAPEQVGEFFGDVKQEAKNFGKKAAKGFKGGT